jgi:hypothetical protein
VAFQAPAASSSNNRSHAVSLPREFRRRVDKESIIKSKEIVRGAAIEVGGIIEEDNLADDELIQEEEDLPGFELNFR